MKPGKPRCPSCRRWLTSDNSPERAQAALSIWRLTKDANFVLPILTKLLREGGLEWEPLEVIAEMGPAAEPVVPDLIRALEKDESVQIFAAEALGKIGPGAASALPALRKLLEHQEKDVREAAQQAISAIEAKPESEDRKRRRGVTRLTLAETATVAIGVARFPPPPAAAHDSVDVCSLRPPTHLGAGAAQPIGVELSRAIDALVLVSAEVIALGLQQIGRQHGAAVTVVVGQCGAEGGHRNAEPGRDHHAHRATPHPPPRPRPGSSGTAAGSAGCGSAANASMIRSRNCARIMHPPRHRRAHRP